MDQHDPRRRLDDEAHPARPEQATPEVLHLSHSRRPATRSHSPPHPACIRCARDRSTLPHPPFLPIGTLPSPSRRFATVDSSRAAPGKESE